MRQLYQEDFHEFWSDKQKLCDLCHSSQATRQSYPNDKPSGIFICLNCRNQNYQSYNDLYYLGNKKQWVINAKIKKETKTKNEVHS